MFGENVFEKLEEWIRELLIELIKTEISGVNSAMKDMLGLMNENITDTPQSWNGTLFTKLQEISNAAIVPIAIGIMTIIICYDLISACLDKNNFKEFDTSIFFRFIVKAWVAIYFINNVFTIVGAIFEIGSNIADTALSQLFSTESEFGSFILSDEFTEILSDCSLIDLVMLSCNVIFINLITVVVMIIITLVTAGRMIEILVYICGAPIPFATMTNREWSNVGFSYIKNICALALQAFFIVIIVAIYMILFNTAVTTPSDITGLTGSLFKCGCYSVICCFMLLKTGSIAKSICGTH